MSGRVTSSTRLWLSRPRSDIHTVPCDASCCVHISALILCRLLSWNIDDAYTVVVARIADFGRQRVFPFSDFHHLRLLIESISPSSGRRF